MEQGYTHATLEGGLMPKFGDRHPPIGNKDRSQLWSQKMTQCQVKRWPNTKSKDDPVPSQTKVCLFEPKDLDYPQKFLLRAVAYLGNPTILSF
jgi:hypothetical protein